jgi:hypothetical protein
LFGDGEDRVRRFLLEIDASYRTKAAVMDISENIKYAAVAAVPWANDRIMVVM